MTYTLHVYNNSTGTWSVTNPGTSTEMPGTSTLSFGEFIYPHASNVDRVWADTNAIDGWNDVRNLFGYQIKVTAGFAYPWSQAHESNSQHWAGLAFDGVPLNSGTLTELYNAAETEYNSTSIVNYVEPMSLSVDHVHWDMRSSKSLAGYPQISSGAKGVYVMLLQHDLEHLKAKGYFTSSISTWSWGTYDSNTIQLVKDYQTAKGLAVDGICGPNTWTDVATDAYNSGY